MRRAPDPRLALPPASRSRRAAGTLGVALLVLLATGSLAWAHDWNGMAQDSKGRLYVVDAEDGRIWRLERDGTARIHLTAAKAEQCNHPHHLAFDDEDVLWLASG